MSLTHHQLCERAAAWLRSNRKCNPVLTKIASAGEIPDAIGWSSVWKHRGSIVVECKTSRADFTADKWKYVRYRVPGHHYPINGTDHRRSKLLAAFPEAVAEAIPNMGDFRFFMSEPEIITAEMVAESRPDHGLLHIIGRRVQVVIDSPRRESVCHATEVHYLRFALIHVEDNLLKAGCSVDMTELTKFFGGKGLRLPRQPDDELAGPRWNLTPK